MTKSFLPAFIALFLAGCSTSPVAESTSKVPSPTPEASSSVGAVSVHGRLRTAGNQIVGKHGEPVSLAGMSFFWSQWKGEFYQPSTVAWLKADWQANLVRAAVGVGRDGQPDPDLDKVHALIRAAIDQDIYVIIDWHDHRAEAHTAAAVAFFEEMARTYAGNPHVIYEIYNEPLQVSWSETIKPYAETVIAAIRAHDPDNLIIVGTPNWSQRVDEAAADPLDDSNVAYTLHFYAGTHKADLRARAITALEANIALFVTEWGTVNADGDGEVDHESVAAWMKFMRQWNLSHANWAVSDKEEGASIVRPGASTSGGWTDDDLTASGRFVRELIRDWNQPVAR
ncbi:glycoside hydrolase family 5 protein [Synoicihabitans lomoniglobus]|uniref:Glycoside hydrolase family 5 protein n=2 Tax=Synoicihabitans lomoniglobus TaxID=2909285 RepID=A0AAF0CRM3_9BACT|nr:glycoside hydrolase family 5 protein [Opitutaceae bacterium LMO-M01]